MPARVPVAARAGGLATLAASLVVSACGGGQAAPRVAAAAPAEHGEAILQRVCTRCHDLGGISAYAGYWGEGEWRSMIDTMVGYGARITPEEIDVLAPYLAEHAATAGSGARPGPRAQGFQGGA
ncbi:MAG TPA: cytochrome c [Longimicrobiales bacterium]|nr:cytochrome c [Longimicrobiales bacterium]